MLAQSKVPARLAPGPAALALMIPIDNDNTDGQNDVHPGIIINYSLTVRVRKCVWGGGGKVL